MRNMYCFKKENESVSKEIEAQKKGLKYQLYDNKKRPIIQIDDKGKKHIYPYEIWITFD